MIQDIALGVFGVVLGWLLSVVLLTVIDLLFFHLMKARQAKREAEQ